MRKYLHVPSDYKINSIVSSKNTDEWLPVFYYIYKTLTLPPKRLQYNGWQNETMMIHGMKYTLAQAWMLWVHTAVPEELQLCDWWTQKFVYAIVDNEPTLRIYGDMRDAYRYYDIDKKISREFYLQYKVSDNAQCHECHEYKEVFDMCGTHDNMGICFDCLQKLIERGECPVCHETPKMKP